MKTIKIFLASSDELVNDRNAFGNLVRRLDKIYEQKGIRIELFEWEDYDAAYNDRRKQDEYNVQVRACDMFLALFHIKAGRYTIEEFNVATEEFRRTGKTPKSYVYCRDLASGEQESFELKEFKKHLFNELGHYWCKYNNQESMQLHFVMQLLLFDNNRMDDLKVEDGWVLLDNMQIAQMSNLSFVEGNDAYQKMLSELAYLPQKIEKAQLRSEKYPDDDDLKEELQQLINRQNSLKSSIANHQSSLLETAKKIAQLQGAIITNRMRRAIDAFNEGKVHEASIILNEVESDAEQAINDYRDSLKYAEEKRKLVEQSIDELTLKISMIMADAEVSIESRTQQVYIIYEQIDELASEIDYNKEKYNDILYSYAHLLGEYGSYEKSLKIYLRHIEIAKVLYGRNSFKLTKSYNNVGCIFLHLGELEQALKYIRKAIDLSESRVGKDLHPLTLMYNVPGINKAFSKETYIEDHYFLSASYNNLGQIYYAKKDYSKALKCHKKAKDISEKIIATKANGVLGPWLRQKEEREKKWALCQIATAYDNIGLDYMAQKKYSEALGNQLEALKIFEKELESEQSDIAICYDNIGLTLQEQGELFLALEYYTKAFKIFEKVLGPKHPETVVCLNRVRHVYIILAAIHFQQNDYLTALNYSKIALGLSGRTMGQDHSETNTIRGNVNMLIDILINQEHFHNVIVFHDELDGLLRKQGFCKEYLLLQFNKWKEGMDLEILTDELDKSKEVEKELLFIELNSDDNNFVLGDYYHETFPVEPLGARFSDMLIPNEIYQNALELQQKYESSKL